MSDSINHPSHYNYSGVEPIDVIEAWGLGFHLGNALKYIARCDHKGSAMEDLKKARWYLDREIHRRVMEATARECNRVAASFPKPPAFASGKV